MLNKKCFTAGIGILFSLGRLSADELTPTLLTASTSVTWNEKDTGVTFYIQNKSKNPIKVSEFGYNGSPIKITRPSGTTIELVAIVDWLVAPAPLEPNSSLKTTKNPLETMNSARLFETGLFRFWGIVNTNATGFPSSEVLIYRDESAPKIHPGWGESIDNPEVVKELLETDGYSRFQKELRSDQIAAIEGTKQFLFAHPYTLALFLDVDEGQGLKVAAFATNTSVSPLTLSALGSADNYLELRTPIQGQILRYPVALEESKDVQIATGQTKRWVANISDLLLKYGSTRAGQYTVSWTVSGKKVTEFSFVRPEIKALPK